MSSAALVAVKADGHHISNRLYKVLLPKLHGNCDLFEVFRSSSQTFMQRTVSFQAQQAYQSITVSFPLGQYPASI